MLISMKAKWLLIIGFFCLLLLNAAYSQDQATKPNNYLRLNWKQVATQMPDAWYGLGEAKTVAESVLKYQTDIGGWPKNSGFHNNTVNQEEWDRIKVTGVGATFDNGATITELKFLTKVYTQIKDERYRESFMKGLNYIIKAQYTNGGWPQYYPPRKGKSDYSSHITYNDNAMVNVMRCLDDVAKQHPMYAPMQISDEMRRKAKEAFDKGVECILRTQIIVDGLPTVWCAQHDEFTLAPAGARSYELPSFCGSESAGITLLLMDLENPSPEVISAVRGAVKWFKDHKIEGVTIKNEVGADGMDDRIVVQDSTAEALWGRFHDLGTGKPFFCDRDGIKKDTLSEIGQNRRVGYDWYTRAPAKVVDRYPEWASKLGIEPDSVNPGRKKAEAVSAAEKKADLLPAPTDADIAKLGAEVGLNDQQQSRVSALLEELKEKRRTIKVDANLSSEEKRTKTKVLNEEILGRGGKISALMTAEQFARWEKFQQAIREARNGGKTAAAF